MTELIIKCDWHTKDKEKTEWANKELVPLIDKGFKIIGMSGWGQGKWDSGPFDTDESHCYLLQK